jgi:DNA-binding SARP family transcriptional activator
VYLWNAEYSLAAEAARDAVAIAPLRETSHQLLMRALASAGNTAEALKAYENCRKLIASELGVDPSPQTRAVYEEILGALRNA